MRRLILLLAAILSVGIPLAQDMEVKRLELDAIDKATAYERDHPGEVNPYRDYLASLNKEHQAKPVRQRSFFARNWWWVLGCDRCLGACKPFHRGPEISALAPGKRAEQDTDQILSPGLKWRFL